MPELRPNVIGKDGRKRQGRGFSFNEISAAGMTAQTAKGIGMIIDRRRKSSLDENVRVLQYLKVEAEKK